MPLWFMGMAQFISSTKHNRSILIANSHFWYQKVMFVLCSVENLITKNNDI